MQAAQAPERVGDDVEQNEDDHEMYEHHIVAGIVPDPVHHGEYWRVACLIDNSHIHEILDSQLRKARQRAGLFFSVCHFWFKIENTNGPELEPNSLGKESPDKNCSHTRPIRET